MNAFLLLRALSAFLGKSVEDYAAAQGENGDYVTPRVFEWYLPFKNPKQPDKIDFPYIVARIDSGEDSHITPQAQMYSHVKVDLSFGVYSEGTQVDGFVHPDGAYDLLNLMEHIRIALQKQRILDNKFRMEEPYKWNIPDEQPYPIWVGQSTSIWSVPRVIEQIEGVDIHGHKFDWE